MIRISAVYANEHGSRFDTQYYQHRHEPFATDLLTPHGLLGLRTTLGEAALDGAAPPFWAISELLFASREVFDAALSHCGEALFADIINYTDVAPTLQVSVLGSDWNKGA
ncbi:EthD family reductase [Novosphingobium sp. 9U]|uniref:EthD family reductase n=1 Tax=Novosphingobium sp. 9U TaxID=2653158 RepID=UPI0012F2D2A9|nr:EthD family reductase [Novosphingobium sp. 9U]VWX47303.1 Ethyl tert-butyl ether degradation EthD [Novosphingobium sp. 9U]